ncbi:Coiled-coil domain-containing protein 25 [Cyberlindnera fabianii]|uniref:Coiled-coil domain-containing protein 25 n=1 Tax=Cyberlindnera fabianii TaxID=36022 RepID=A0A1V2L7U1_CYBFA|nr:Coiled-coil domain-containing protein 25 [Cyberlindnera fabianii]
MFPDCAQLTKANSIQGNKRDNVTIIYTPWANLRKSKGMAEGEVSFKNPKRVKKIHIQFKDNAILNRLKKTREELVGRNLLIAARNARDKDAVQRALQAKREEKAAAEAEKRRAVEEKKRQESLYDDIFTEEEVEKASNKRRMTEDFM